MADIIRTIIKNVLIALYQPFWFAVALAVLSMFFIMYAKERSENLYNGIKILAKEWITNFKGDNKFRKHFVLIFYLALLLFKTLLSRAMHINPVTNVIGVWGLYDADGKLTTEVPENLALFIPFTILLLWTYRDKILNKVTLPNVLFQSTKIVFLFSFTIEFLQLFLRLGTWQLSDLFYNTLGGFIGGLVYWIGYRIQKHNKT